MIITINVPLDIELDDNGNMVAIETIPVMKQYIPILSKVVEALEKLNNGKEVSGN